ARTSKLLLLTSYYSPLMRIDRMTNDIPALPRLQQTALTVGAICLGAGAAGAFSNPDQFFRSWLLGFLFCLGLTMGSLALLMLQHMSGGQWGLMGRRVFEAASRNLPVVVLIFIPLLFRLPGVYPWAEPGVRAGE